MLRKNYRPFLIQLKNINIDYLCTNFFKTCFKIRLKRFSRFSQSFGVANNITDWIKRNFENWEKISCAYLNFQLAVFLGA